MRNRYGQFFGNVKQRMSHLTGNQIDFVAVGGGDNHIGAAGARLFQNVRMRRRTVYRLNVPFLGRFVEFVRIRVYNNDVVAAAAEIGNNTPADRTGAADDDFHSSSPCSLCSQLSK